MVSLAFKVPVLSEKLFVGQKAPERSTQLSFCFVDESIFFYSRQTLLKFNPFHHKFTQTKKFAALRLWPFIILIIIAE